MNTLQTARHPHQVRQDLEGQFERQYGPLDAHRREALDANQKRFDAAEKRRDEATMKECDQLARDLGEPMDHLAAAGKALEKLGDAVAQFGKAATPGQLTGPEIDQWVERAVVQGRADHVLQAVERALMRYVEPRGGRIRAHLRGLYQSPVGVAVLLGLIAILALLLWGCGGVR